MLKNMTSCTGCIGLTPLFSLSGLLTLHHHLHLCVWGCSICSQSQQKFRWEKTSGDPAPDWPAPAKSLANSVSFLRPLFSSVLNTSKEGYRVLQESDDWVILCITFCPPSQQPNYFIAFLKNYSSSLAWHSSRYGWTGVLGETISAPYGDFISPLGEQC